MSGGANGAAPLELRRLTGPALGEALDDVARLRIKVFRAFPYLYDGDAAYERAYLQTYQDSPGAIVVGAYEGARLVGAATGTPMTEQEQGFGAALEARGLDPARIFYCAESVLLPEYRGRGVGHGFFDAREAHARALGHDICVFCSVIRPGDHPRRPADHRPLDAFWRGRGYAPVPGARAHISWKDIGADAETDHALQFWMRRL